MTDANTAMVEKYRNSFLKEVEANVEEGDWVRCACSVECAQALVRLVLTGSIRRRKYS